MKNKEAKKWRSQEVKMNRRMKKPRSRRIKKPRIEEAKNEEAKKNSKNHKNNFKYFTIFNTSLFYKPFSTTSKSI